MKKAFTLAEVLITLVIIGIISAITIPQIMLSVHNQEFKTGYKKAYSDISNAAIAGMINKELPKADIAASFQENVTATLFKKTKKAADSINAKTIVLAGGVAANSEIRRKFFALREQGYNIYAPQMKYCTDNAAMIASSAYFSTDTTGDLNVEVFSRMS